MIRDVVVMLWGGPKVVARLNFTPDDVDLMSGQEAKKYLVAFGVTVPDSWSNDERCARLKEWPNQADRDAIAVAHTGWNDGVRPTVRVLERSTLPSRRRLMGAAGSVPR